jgi:D-glycero-alpha-D-manno-heptose 1-phosphate guanylyltransferase
MKNNLNNKIDEILILCGGLGTRLKNFSNDLPKSMVKVDNKVFLDCLVDKIRREYNKTITLLLSHKSEYFIDYFKNKKDIKFHIDKELLGTGGSVKSYLNQNKKTSNIILINGDSYFDFNLNYCVDFHYQKRSNFTVVTAVSSDDKFDKGILQSDNNCMMLSFGEKVIKNNRYSSSGIYIFEKNIFFEIKKNKFSIEFDLLPKIIKKYSCFEYKTDNIYFDIGTPERFSIFKNFYLKNKK